METYEEKMSLFEVLRRFYSIENRYFWLFQRHPNYLQKCSEFFAYFAFSNF